VSGATTSEFTDKVSVTVVVESVASVVVDPEPHAINVNATQTTAKNIDFFILR
jgi:hypothetical protein